MEKIKKKNKGKNVKNKPPVKKKNKVVKKKNSDDKKVTILRSISISSREDCLIISLSVFNGNNEIINTIKSLPYLYASKLLNALIIIFIKLSI